MRRSPTGQVAVERGLSGVDRLAGPPLSRQRGRWRIKVIAVAGWAGESVPPAVGERAADQAEVAANRGGRADLEIGPAQLLFYLLVALLQPGAQPGAAHHLGQA